jgi:hypothetical protein
MSNARCRGNCRLRDQCRVVTALHPTNETLLISNWKTSGLSIQKRGNVGEEDTSYRKPEKTEYDIRHIIDNHS